MNWRPVRVALGTGLLYLALAAALERDARLKEGLDTLRRACGVYGIMRSDN